MLCILQKELESIEFYIEQGYQDLARQALDEVEMNFGALPEIAALRSRLGNRLAKIRSLPEKPLSQTPLDRGS